MIQLSLINEEQVFEEVNKKILGVKELTSTFVMTKIASTIFQVSKREFARDLNRLARSNPQRFHHIYEWNRVGDNRARLYDIVRVSSSPNMLVVQGTFRQSRSLVPLGELVSTPGPTGKSVVRRSVFRNKADMMEHARQAGFVAKRNIVFEANNELVFRSKGQRINNRMPEETRGQFTEFMNTWYATRLPGIIARSRLFEDIEMTTAKTLNVTGSGPKQVREAVLLSLQKYEVTE